MGLELNPKDGCVVGFDPSPNEGCVVDAAGGFEPNPKKAASMLRDSSQSQTTELSMDSSRMLELSTIDYQRKPL